MLCVFRRFWSGNKYTDCKRYPQALLTKDGVYFYANLNRILSNSSNAFNGLLHQGLQCHTPNSIGVPVVHVDELSDVLNIIIHAIFDMSCAAYAPSLDTMTDAVSRMPTYGLCPAQYLVSSAPLFALLLAQAPVHGITVYALAGEHQLEELAVLVSSHLLSFPLSNITDDLAQRIGPTYLRRLFFLHIGRVEALKRLVKPGLYPHSPTSACGFSTQKGVGRAWSLAAAYIAWDARPGGYPLMLLVINSPFQLDVPDTSNSSIKAAFAGLFDDVECAECNLSLAKRLKDVIVNWSKVKVQLLSTPHPFAVLIQI